MLTLSTIVVCPACVLGELCGLRARAARRCETDRFVEKTGDLEGPSVVRVTIARKQREVVEPG